MAETAVAASLLGSRLSISYVKALQNICFYEIIIPVRAGPFYEICVTHFVTH